MKERIVHFPVASKFVLRCLPFLLSFVLLFVPAIDVSAATGVGSLWDGSFNVVFPQSFLYMNYSREYEYNLTDTTAKPHNTFTVYESSDNVRIEIESYTTDVYLNGNFRVRVTASPAEVNSAFSYLTISSDPIILPGVYVSTELINRAYGGTTTYDIYIEFDNYYVDNSNISLPLKINHELSAVWSTPTTLPKNVIKYNISIVSDYAGTVKQYDNLEDVPSLDGYFAEQNTEIINNTTINNDLLQQQIQQDHQDTLDQTNELTNGYQSSLVGSAENDFNAGAGQLTGIEDTLSDSSTQYVDTFTSTGFDDSLLDSIAPSMQYVVTWFTNFWNMGGALTKCFTLCFALYIAFYILRVRS